jgi:hypothetical protein
MISEAIQRVATKVWHALGPGRYDNVYIDALTHELSQFSGNKNKLTIGSSELNLDFGTDSKEHVIIEVRAMPSLRPIDITYMRQFNLRRLYFGPTSGYFINFGATGPEIATF